MAVLPLCARLGTGQDVSCVPVQRKYYQQAVLINKTDIVPNPAAVTKTDYETAPNSPLYNVKFALKPGTKGYRFSGSENGSVYFGRTNKSTSDLGMPQYSQEVQILIVGAGQPTKAILEAIDKGSYVVAMQFGDGTIEIYGYDNGLSTGDYTYSIQENGGGTTIVLSSNDSSPESSHPFVYISGTPGQETEDFDSAFEVPVTP